ncbi:unnamed protein product [Linum tenue]|uniref:Uncharacterized protein n=1 Tax=Linum tenue TaxID=586396 RepID=A0AAV0QD23_9ROSI|nr:unnamed protein product [Linum tenue]
MIKAVKKLKKFWPRKKRKKKASVYQHDPSYYHLNSTCHCCYSYSIPPPPPPPQPSAPPLPAWLETSPLMQQQNVSQFSYQTHTSRFTSEEITVEAIQSCPTENTLPSSSYQQYMDPQPVYGVPANVALAQQTSSTKLERKSAGGFFTSVAKFGANLFGCFLPCFRIQEVHMI